MLKLKRLELHGFKSFCDKEQLQFGGSGIASIVGPNGCGKSNVSDAISWVLGEQSAKSLRGARMQDVIFNGSRDRKPSGLSAVSITLYDNEAANGRPSGHVNGAGGAAVHPTNGHGTTNGAPKAAALPPAKRPGEITVTRKLFRSGESQYLINGKVRRLRDIQDLFMGTGLGPNHYAIIEQGRIGQVLSSKPLDRRAIVEEAAGVTKFKSRKRLAELKLESAKQNLNRVNDILQEVIRQVGSLKRQASKARRYEELKGQLDSALTAMLASRHRRMSAEIEQGEAALGAADAALKEQLERAARLESEITQKRAQEKDWEDELESGRARLSEATVETERVKSRIEQQRRTAQENESREKHAAAEIEALVERLAQLQQELSAEQEAVEAVSRQSEQVRVRLAERNEAVDLRHNEIAELEREQEAARKRVIVLLGEAAGLRNQVAKIEEFLAGNERQTARVKDEAEQARQELEQIESGRRSTEAETAQRRQELGELAAKADDVEEAVSTLEVEIRDRRSASDQLQGELSKLRARCDSLEEILSHHAYTTESVKNLFGAVERAPVSDFRPMGVLADFVDVDPEYERAAEDFLREELEYVLVQDWSEASRGVELLRTDLDGHATFLVHPEKPVPGEEPALGPETGVTGRLADSVRLTNGLAASASTLLPKLRSCYFVEDEAAARRLSVRYPDLYFLLPNGVCYRGHTMSGGRKRNAGPLALKRELRELRPKLSALEASFAANRDAVAKAEELIAAKKGQREKLREAVQRLEKAVLAGEHQLERVHQEAERAERRVKLASEEAARLEREAERAVAERSERQKQIEQHERGQQGAESAIASLKQRIDGSQAELTKLSEELTALRTEAATLDERRRSAAASLSRVRHLAEEQGQRKERVEQQSSQWAEERLRLLAENGELAGRVVELETERKELAERVSRVAKQLDESRSRTIEMEEEGRGLRVEVEEARQRRSGIELDLVQKRSNYKHLAEMCERELGKSLEETAASVAGELSDEEVANAEEAYQELRTKIERLGPVNVLALEEYKEAEQRHEFLQTQEHDLLESIRDTQQAIHEIDTASRKQFKEAFDAINANFQKTFQTLFGGGIGEMRLTDEENLSESGVDIVASPPGKKLQNVALLSGGEKSLTALALLVATFQFHPSPFCVLDEVDAALDEPNIMRFKRLLESMADQTQFVVITHSKATMQSAGTLYGVTMEEPGVSKLVSVRNERPPTGVQGG